MKARQGREGRVYCNPDNLIKLWVKDTWNRSSWYTLHDDAASRPELAVQAEKPFLNSDFDFLTNNKHKSAGLV